MWLERLHAWIQQGEPCVLATVIGTTGSAPRGPGAKLALSAAGEAEGSVGGGVIEHLCRAAVADVLATGTPMTLRFCLVGGEWAALVPEDGCFPDATVTVFVEPLLPAAEVVLFGAGHVAVALSRLLETWGIPYRVYDDRPGFPTSERFPRATQTVLGSFENLDPAFRLRSSSYCVILTHAHAHDERVLEQLVAQPDIPYIGMIGSLSKVRGAFQRLKEKGLTIDGRVFAPVGLALGGREPMDIALSILAEIRLVQHGGEIRHCRMVVPATPES